MSGFSFSRLMLAALVGGLFIGLVSQADAANCKWFGTKPFCDGQCPAGWDYTGKRRSCTTGSQRYCCERMGTTTHVDKVAPCHTQCAPLLGSVKPAAEASRVYSNCRALCDRKGTVRCPDGTVKSWRTPKC
jgi:hypothetical protein